MGSGWEDDHGGSFRQRDVLTWSGGRRFTSSADAVSDRGPAFPSEYRGPLFPVVSGLPWLFGQEDDAGSRCDADREYGRVLELVSFVGDRCAPSCSAGSTATPRAGEVIAI